MSPARGRRNAKKDPTVCYCRRVSRGAIVDAIREGASSIEEIQRRTRAGTGSRCRELNPKGACCIPDIQAVLEGASGERKGGAGRCRCC